MMAEKTGRNVSGGMRASPKLGVVDFMVRSVIGDERCPTKAKCIDRDVRGNKWPDVIMDGIPVKLKRHKKESVRVSCFMWFDGVSCSKEVEGYGCAVLVRTVGL